MLIKVDVEKTYDTLRWDIILATLAWICFPSVWLSWIRACFTLVSSYFIINGRPSKWISPTRGVR